MGLNKTKILGISITTNPREEILEEIQKYLKNSTNNARKQLTIVTPNPEQIVLAQKNQQFANIINRADIAIPDGIGLVWAIQKKDSSLAVRRVPGVELMEDLVRLAVKEAHTIGLIGGWRGVAVKALECLQKKYPGLVGWAMEPEGKTIEEIGRKISDTDTRIVFVGLGAPKQEYFIRSLSFRPSLPQRRLGSRNPGRKTWIPGHLPASALHRQLQAGARDDNKNIVLMAVGGSFDIIAGKTPRAPFVLRTIGIEWLWRLIREPWRWRRQMALLKFLWLVPQRKG